MLPYHFLMIDKKNCGSWDVNLSLASEGGHATKSLRNTGIIKYFSFHAPFTQYTQDCSDH